MINMGKEKLKELLEMGSVPVCRTLHHLLGKRAKLSVMDIKKVGMEDIAGHLPRFNVVIEGSGGNGERRAELMFIFKKEDMARLANYAMGSDLNRDLSLIHI